MARNFVLGIVVGAAVGAALGSLYAPKPGCRTRRDLTAKGRDAAMRLKHWRLEKEEPVRQSI